MAKTFFIILGILGGFVLIFFIVLKLDFYPAVLISGRIITNRQFNKILDSSFVYFQKSLAVYATGAPALDPAFQKEIKRAILEKLIENQIIDKALLKKMGAAGLKKAVNEKLADFPLNGSLAEASKTLYNLSLEDFKQLVLVPQAKMEILQEQGIDLQALKKSHRPVILMPGFYWQENQVFLR